MSTNIVPAVLTALGTFFFSTILQGADPDLALVASVIFGIIYLVDSDFLDGVFLTCGVARPLQNLFSGDPDKRKQPGEGARPLPKTMLQAYGGPHVPTARCTTGFTA